MKGTPFCLEPLKWLLPSLTFATLTLPSHGQLTWDPTLDGGTGAAGTWNTTNPNWWNGATDQAWDNTGATAAEFGSGSDYAVSLDTAAVIVGDLGILSGSNTVTLAATAANNGVTVAGGGATWDLNGNTLAFASANNTRLTMGADTLTVLDGDFHTGTTQNSDWSVGSATLDFQGGTLFGQQRTVGQFGTVKMASGTNFIYSRNTNNTFFGDWILDGSGSVTFGNDFNRISFINGAVSGSARMVYADGGNVGSFLRLNNTSNSFTGGITSDGTLSETSIQLNGTDAVLGAVPGSFDADNIILRNGGIIEIANMGTMNANRGITLDGGGTIIAAHATTINGLIGGSGDLDVGHVGRGANVLTLDGTGSSYTGETNIIKGTVVAGVADALPTGSVLSIGGTGGSTSAFEMNGNATEIGGLASQGSNTKELRNNGAATTLTVDVADGESHLYSGNIIGSGAIAVVKTGTGTQAFFRGGGAGSFSAAPASITVAGGELSWSALGGGTTTVAEGATLSGLGAFDGAVDVAGNLEPGASPGTLTFNGSLTLQSSATLTIEFGGLSDFDVLLNGDGDDTFTAAGALALELFDGYVPLEGDVFQVLENWGGFAGSFDSVTGTDIGGGLALDTTDLLVDGTVVVVPEARVVLLGLVGLMGLLRRRRC